MNPFGFLGKKRIYLDHASAPPVRAEALRAMRHAESLLGNPGAIHQEGVEARAALEKARDSIALQVGCKAREIHFTSGLTESNALAILGCARQLELERRSLSGIHFLVSSIEHASVLEAFAEIERLGGTVSYIEPSEDGLYDPPTVQRALRAETALISIGWANNEIGVVQPLGDIARILREHEQRHSSRIVFHSDAGQAPLYLPTVIQSLGVDMLSIGSNKLYGPHGIGALVIRNRVPLSPIFPGRQERGLRAGTENAALAAGFAAAYEAAAGEREHEARRIAPLRDAFALALQQRVPGCLINGDLAHALPHLLNISMPDISSEYVALSLDHRGVAVSTKSACREGEESRSHAVAALGGPEWRASNTLRFSLGRDTREADLHRVADIVAELCVRKG